MTSLRDDVVTIMEWQLAKQNGNFLTVMLSTFWDMGMDVGMLDEVKELFNDHDIQMGLIWVRIFQSSYLCATGLLRLIVFYFLFLKRVR